MSSKKSKIDINKMKELKENFEKSFCPTYNKMIYAIYGLSLLFNSLIIISLTNLEKNECKCDDIPEKKFLKEWFIFNLIFNLIILVYFLLSNKTCYYHIKQDTFIYVISSIVYLITFVMLIRLLIFLNILRNNCNCGFGSLENVLFWYFIIIFSMIALFIILSIILLLFGLIKMQS